MITGSSIRVGALILVAAAAFCLADVDPGKAAEHPSQTPVVLARLQAPQVGRLDRSVRQVLETWELPLPGPLALAEGSGLKGLDSNGPFTLLVLRVNEEPLELRLAVGLPIDNYQAFVTALGGSDEPVTAVRVAGADMLVGRLGNVAVLMDEVDRKTLESVLADPTFLKSQAPAEWSDSSEIVLEVSSHGVRCLDASQHATTAENALAPSDNDLFGPIDEPAEDPRGAGPRESDDLDGSGRSAADRAVGRLMEQIAGQVAQNPLLSALAGDVETAATRIRRTEQGEVSAQLRLTWREDSQFMDMERKEAPQLRPGFFKQPFVLFGTGALPAPLRDAIATEYVRQFVKTFDQTQLRESDVEQLTAAILKLNGLMKGLGVLQRPADEDVGVHTNQFMLIQCRDSAAVMAAVVDVVKAWNWLMDNANGEIMQLGSKSLKVSKRDAVLYDADMTAIFAPNPDSVALPEIRAAMEKLFGKDGYFRLLVVQLDGSNVLLACGSVEQTEQLIADLEAEQAAAVAESRPQATGAEQFRVVVNPHNFSRQLHDTHHAEFGDVLGAPPQRTFPLSPPATASLQIKQEGIDVVVSLPSGTMEAAGQFLKSLR